jgi:hypothetical protein
MSLLQCGAAAAALLGLPAVYRSEWGWPIVRDDLDLDPRAQRLEGAQVRQLVGTHGNGPVEALPARAGSHSAQIHDLDWDAGLAKRKDRSGRSNQDDHRFRRRGQLDAACGALCHAENLDGDTRGRGQDQDLAEELVAGRVVVDDDDPPGSECAKPHGNHLAVDQAVVDAD